MKVKVLTRSPARKALIQVAAAVYIRRLNLEKSKWTLTIYSIANLAKLEGMSGVACLTGPKEIGVGLDSRLPWHTLMNTLAHEMVHVKQHAKGQLKQKTNKNGKTTTRWLGRVHPNHALTSPWELEAYSRERILSNEIMAIITDMK